MMNAKRQMAALTILSWLAAAVIVSPAAARADVIFSDFGPGDAYDSDTAVPIAGALSSYGVAVTWGYSFTAGATETLSEIDGAFTSVSGSKLIDLALYADNGSGNIGTLIESYQNVGPAVPSPGSILSVSSVLHPLLTAGDTYWLVASAADTGSYTEWNQNSTGALGTRYLDIDGFISYSAENFLPAFSLTGSAVPEPSSLILAGVAAVLGMAVFRRDASESRRHPKFVHCRGETSGAPMGESHDTRDE